MDRHTTQQAKRTTYEDPEWREEWVDEEMRMEREVEMGEWEEGLYARSMVCTFNRG